MSVNMITGENNNIVCAEITCVYDGTKERTFSCKADLHNRTIFDVQMNPEDVADCDCCQGATLRLPDDSEHDVFVEDDVRSGRRHAGNDFLWK